MKEPNCPRAAKPAGYFQVGDIDEHGNTYLGFNPRSKAKPANRPRAAHKLNLKDGDRVPRVAWQDGILLGIGFEYDVRGPWLVNEDNLPVWMVKSPEPKGKRPLFTVVSRAAGPKMNSVKISCTPENAINLSDMISKGMVTPMPDEVIEFYFATLLSGRKVIADTHQHLSGDVYKIKIVFPAGSDTGTVTREKPL